MIRISKDVMKKIKAKGLKPKPRWEFIAMRVLFALSLTASVLVGGMSMGIIFEVLGGTAWKFAPEMGPRFLIMLPYLWFALLGLMLFAATKVFAKTKKGYKHHPVKVLGICVLISVVLGAGLYQSHSSRDMHDFVRENVSPYERLESFRESQWMHPENGTLFGEVTEVEADSLRLTGPRGEEWTVELSKAEEIEVGQRIVLRGEIVEEGLFQAEDYQEMRGRPGSREENERKPGPRM